MKSRSSAGWTGHGPVTLTSTEIPSEARFTVPFTAGAPVITLRPKACFGMSKFPVPSPWCVQVTTVPPFDTCGIHWRLRLSTKEPGGKSVEVGGVAATTPASPDSVIVATSPGGGQTA